MNEQSKTFVMFVGRLLVASFTALAVLFLSLSFFAVVCHFLRCEPLGPMLEVAPAISVSMSVLMFFFVMYSFAKTAAQLRKGVLRNYEDRETSDTSRDLFMSYLAAALFTLFIALYLLFLLFYGNFY